MPKAYPKEFRDDVVAVAQRREAGVTIKHGLPPVFGPADLTPVFGPGSRMVQLGCVQCFELGRREHI